MKLEELKGLSCLIGLQYFDTQGNILSRQQYAGIVVNTDEEKGISIQLKSTASSDTISTDSDTISTDKEARIFVLPPNLNTWFKAPAGDYRDEEKNLLVKNPDYLVTWEIHKTQDEKQGDHEWWEWVAPSSSPIVN